jgi:hypothetical protein
LTQINAANDRWFRASSEASALILPCANAWLEEQGHAPLAWPVLGAIANATNRIGQARGYTYEKAKATWIPAQP